MIRPLMLALATALLACGGADAPDAPAADDTARHAAPVATPGDTTPAADSATPADAGQASPGGATTPGTWAMAPLSGEGGGESRGVAVLRDVRIARHEGYDRVVFEFDGHLPPWEVRAVRSPAACGSGDAVDPGGAAALEVDFRPASAHTEEGAPTVRERNRRPGLPALRAARLTCDFEAIVTWVLGVDHAGEIRALELTSPARLAVDIRHR